MSTSERARDRGTRRAAALRAALASELRGSRMSAGVSQGHVAHVAGLSQTMVSRIERAQRPGLTIAEAAVMCAALGLRLQLKAYPEGLPVRDAAQLELLARFRGQVSHTFDWRTEVPIGDQGDLRAWDVVLEGSIGIGVDAETRLYDMQALQRRLELKLRDSDVGRVVLVVSGTHHNRAVLRAHRSALMSTLPLDTAAVMRSLRAGDVPIHNGIVLL